MSIDLEIPSKRRGWVAVLLAVSLACNVAMLFLPFMDLRAGLSSEPYSLINSIKMLWSSGLYVLAVLVVGFSVVFPFAKLAVLTGVCMAGRIDARNEHLLDWVERLGKWSMLDVFLVCIILSLTSGQMMVGAEPLIGIPVFVVAILLSMVAGELLVATIAKSHAGAPVERGPKGTVTRGGVWLALSGLALVGAVGFPFLKISDWLLADRAYSIVQLVPTLWLEGAYTPSVIIGLFLLVAPLAAWLASWRWWWLRLRGKPAHAARRHLLIARHWSMLDVFGLALAIFLVEGEYLMKTEVRWGALFLVALVALERVAQAALNRAFPTEE
jgi:paraquat-inducible protein A